MFIAPLSTIQEMTSLQREAIADPGHKVMQTALDACPNIPRVSTVGPEAAVLETTAANTLEVAGEDAGSEVVASEAVEVGVTGVGRAAATAVSEKPSPDAVADESATARGTEAGDPAAPGVDNTTAPRCTLPPLAATLC